jgi:hypothetical protein
MTAGQRAREVNSAGDDSWRHLSLSLTREQKYSIQQEETNGARIQKRQHLLLCIADAIYLPPSKKK